MPRISVPKGSSASSRRSEPSAGRPTRSARASSSVRRASPRGLKRGADARPSRARGSPEAPTGRQGPAASPRHLRRPATARRGRRVVSRGRRFSASRRANASRAACTASSAASTAARASASAALSRLPSAMAMRSSGTGATDAQAVPGRSPLIRDASPQIPHRDDDTVGALGQVHGDAPRDLRAPRAKTSASAISARSRTSSANAMPGRPRTSAGGCEKTHRGPLPCRSCGKGRPLSAAIQ